jgi:hypothetical protein
LVIEKLKISPTIEDVKSGKTPKPKLIRIATVLASGQEERQDIIMKSAWKPDYEDKALDWFWGLLHTPYHSESLMPWDTSHGHIRAARKVAAAIFGLQRFRNVRIYGPFRGEKLCFIKKGKESALLLGMRDANIWSAISIRASLKSDIQFLTPLEAKEKLYPEWDVTEVIKLAQESSMRIFHKVFKAQIMAKEGIFENEKIQKLKKKVPREVLESILEEGLTKRFEIVGEYKDVDDL